MLDHFQMGPNLVRGFDYYTETLWEVVAGGLGAARFEAIMTDVLARLGDGDLEVALLHAGLDDADVEHRRAGGQRPEVLHVA